MELDNGYIDFIVLCYFVTICWHWTTYFWLFQYSSFIKKIWKCCISFDMHLLNVKFVRLFIFSNCQFYGTNFQRFPIKIKGVKWKSKCAYIIGITFDCMLWRYLNIRDHQLSWKHNFVCFIIRIKWHIHDKLINTCNEAINFCTQNRKFICSHGNVTFMQTTLFILIFPWLPKVQL